LAKSSLRPRMRPTDIPAQAPKKKPARVSTTVIQPCENRRPLATRSMKRLPISNGELTKNGSINGPEANCHDRKITAKMATRPRKILMFVTLRKKDLRRHGRE